MPLYPSKCCELGSVLRLLLFRCFLLRLTFEPFKELGVRHLVSEFEESSIYLLGSSDGTKEVSQVTHSQLLKGAQM